MSFRNTFITDFIYQASDETRDANAAVTRIFESFADVLISKVDARGYGFYAGTIRTHSGSAKELIDSGIEQHMIELTHATKVPFRVTFLLESNCVITYGVSPDGLS